MLLMKIYIKDVLNIDFEFYGLFTLRIIIEKVLALLFYRFQFTEPSQV